MKRHSRVVYEVLGSQAQSSRRYKDFQSSTLGTATGRKHALNNLPQATA